MRAERLLIVIFFVVSVVCAGAQAREIGWRASGTGGAVAAGRAEAVAAGISILEKGGNAADAAVATPSGNPPYNVCEELGVAHGNRLRSLNTTAGHPNRIEPGKRPRITLMPTLVLKQDKAVIGISVAGGDLQDQTTLNCLLNHIEFGMLPAEAVTAGRFNTEHHEGSFDPNPDRAETFGRLAGVEMNEVVSEEVRRELRKRGHKIETTDEPIGYPVMLYVNPATGMQYAAGDPKARRHATVVQEGPIKSKLDSEQDIRLQSYLYQEGGRGARKKIYRG